MKDSKFIELLNLYVDHQISAADAALLEAEIQQDPKRRQVYRQYCQMQKACTLLADTFRSEAPAADAKVVAFDSRRRRLAPFAYATGLVAAAACVALVLVNRSGSERNPQAPVASVAVVSAPQPAPASTAIAAQPSRATLPALQPVFRGIGDDVLTPAFAKSDVMPFDWMARVRFERVPAEALRFESAPVLPVDDLVFRNARVFDPQTEGAAFRFQK
jgi:anti-sigma factor RsiW